jgi:hypothetical protein
MVNVIIIHGSYGNPEENWIPWLKFELEKLGFKVYVPEFPTPENQNLDNWLKVFDGYKKYLDENSIIIGHSLGCAFILNVLERMDVKIKAAFLVAGFIGKLNNAQFDEINKTFSEREFNWNRIRIRCKYFFVYNSDNDPYVPLKKGIDLAERLNGKLKIIENAGHINKEASFSRFEVLFRDVKEII